MSQIQHSLSRGLTTSALTVFINGEVRCVTSEQPHFEAVVALVEGNGTPEQVLAAMDPATGVNKFFEKVSDRVSVSNGHLYVDNEEVNDGLANTILRYISEGNDPGPLLAFLENLLANPNEHSREQLYDWLSRYDFAITAEGKFVAYKGVASRTGEDADRYPYQSISRGTAIVDGVPYEGAIPNGVGSEVTMPRGDVQHDPSVGCHTGLHAGTWEYASGFSQGTVLVVEINPRDVVSVPTDCNWQKIRTCRYTVVDVADAKVSGSFYGGQVEVDESDDEDDDYFDSGYYGGYDYDGDYDD